MTSPCEAISVCYNGALGFTHFPFVIFFKMSSCPVSFVVSVLVAPTVYFGKLSSLIVKNSLTVTATLTACEQLFVCTTVCMLHMHKRDRLIIGQTWGWPDSHRSGLRTLKNQPIPVPGCSISASLDTLVCHCAVHTLLLNNAFSRLQC